MNIVQKINSIYSQFGADDYVVQFFTMFLVSLLIGIIITSFITAMTRSVR